MKNRKIIYHLLICFIAGLIVSSLAFSGQLAIILNGLSLIKWWLYPIIIILAFYVTLTIHELTHFMSFKRSRTKLRAIYLTIFIFYKTDQGWRFKVDPRLWILFGGLVVPDLAKIKNDEDYKKITTSFKKSLFAAPMATIIYMVFTILTCLLCLMYVKNAFLIGFYFIYTLIVSILSVIYIKSFNVSTSNIFGDFVAYKKIDHNPWFQLVQFMQYQSLSLHNHGYNLYLFNRAKTLLNTRKYINQLFHFMVLNYYLEGINDHNQSHDEALDKLFDHLKFESFKKNEMGLLTLFEFAIFLYDQGKVERSYQMYEKAKKHTYKDVDEQLTTYLYKRYEHVTYLHDHQSYLNQKEHIYTELTWIFEHLIDPYKDIDLKHKKRVYQPFVCLVELDQNKST